MNNTIQKILREPNIPIMSDEGLYALADYIFQRKWMGFEKGPSRRITLADSKPFTMEEPLSAKDKKELECKVFKLVVSEMSKDIISNPRFLTDLYKKNNEYSKFSRNDFIEIVRLVERDQIEEAISTDLGKLIYRLNADFSQDHIGSTEKLPLSKHKEKIEDKDQVRIYINSSNGKTATQFLYEYISKCIELGIPYDLKGLNNTQQERADGTVLYVAIKDLDKSIEILKGINPEFVKTFGTPLASAHNEDYFAICRNPGTQTYNLFFDDVSYITFAKATSILLLEKFKGRLNPDQTRILGELSDKNAFINDLGVKGSIKSRLVKLLNDFSPYIEQLMSAHKDELVSIMREQMNLYSSQVNYGDEEHTEYPVCFNKKIYDHFGIDSLKAVSENIVSKTQISKEQYISLLKADKSRIRFELAKMGLKTEIQGKSEEELKQMLFDRIELDDESIIDILSGETEQLCQFVDALGKDDEYEHRSEYEERFIELMGVDKVIDAVYTVRDKDAQLGRNRKWRFKDSLRSVRLARGKLIFESEEFQKLKTREQRNEFIKNFSEHAKYDVEEYYDLYGKSSTYSK